MTPKAARNLSAVAFVALYGPCQNILVWLNALFPLWGLPPPLDRFFLAAIPVFGPLSVWLFALLMALLAFIPSFALYGYLRRRDFPQLCADCAARKPLVWILFLLFAFLSILHPSVHQVPSTMPPPDYTIMSDENFEAYTYDEYFDAPEDAPPALQPDTQNPELKTQNSPEVPQ